jgi:hypothetical protein
MEMKRVEIRKLPLHVSYISVNLDLIYTLFDISRPDTNLSLDVFDPDVDPQGSAS